MDKLSQLISVYDWNVMLKVIFGFVSIGYVFFWKKLDKYTDEILGVPFVILMSYFIFNSTNLISLIFFIELSLILREVLFRVDYKRFEHYFFNFSRIPLWIISIYCYYATFATFDFVDVVERTDFKLSIVYSNTLFVIGLLCVGLLYRVKYNTVSQAEKISLISILIPSIIFKLIYFLASLNEFVLPEHVSYVSSITLIICTAAFFLSIRFLNNTKTRDSLAIGFTSLLLVSFLPLLTLLNRVFWEDYQYAVVRLIFLLGIFHIFFIAAVRNRLFQLSTFLLMIEVVGLSPFGHLYKYFVFSVDSYDEVISVFGLTLIYLGVAFVIKSAMECLSDER